MARKSPGRVTSITGEPLDDTVSQAYYRLLQQKQADVHQHYVDLVVELFSVRERLIGGAAEEPGPFYLDREKLLVRSRKKGVGSERPRRSRKDKAVSE